MSRQKLVTLILLLLTVCLPLVAKDAVFSGEYYRISLSYNDTACPGDAIFIRMKFSDGEKHDDSPVETSASAHLFLETKEIISSSFYVLSRNETRGTETLLSGLPLSSWWTQGNYRLTVTYSYKGGKQMEFNLPFYITSKEFIQETIPLDETNTNIKTNNSAERMRQIKKLNGVLETIDNSAVYQDTPFTSPTTCTRRTSHFADRRIFTYTNGGSSTSLHFGTDYGQPTGTPVTACAAGKVVMAEFRISTGWSVVIEHLPGLYSLYYHMSSLSVTEGDIVQSGATIGLSGATGLATGPHLHWEMRLNTCAVNPDFFTTDFAFSGKQPPAPFSRQPAEEINSPVEK